jgi:hypothetical protein
MSHLDIIIITGTLFISSTIGVYAALRYINQHTNPAMNTLTRRSGDIELQYIEPSTNNNLDLLQPQQVYTPNINSCLEDSINLQRTQSYWSGNPPSYNTLDLLQPQQVYTFETIPSYFNGSNINSCLEDSMNLNYIYLFFMVVLTIIIIIIINKKIILSLINKLR